MTTAERDALIDAVDELDALARAWLRRRFGLPWGRDPKHIGLAYQNVCRSGSRRDAIERGEW